MGSVIGTIISFIIIFTIIVVAHEYGHFLLGRLNGIKVNEFTIGFGPALFKKKLKSTTLAIRLLPLGGACIFDGETGNVQDEESDEESVEKSEVESVEKSESESVGKSEIPSPKSAEQEEYDPKNRKFNDAPVWGRIATVFAGPLFNVILAYLLAMFVCWFCGQDLPVVYSVTDGMPAAEAGIQAGDTILKINNQRICVWREISVISMMNSGKSIAIEYERDGQVYDTSITPVYNEEEDRYYMGLSGGGDYVSCNNIHIFKYSWYEVRYWLITTYRSLGYLISGHASADSVSGPVGVATIIDDTIEETVQYGYFTVILNMVNIALLLSVNLGVMNLLPLPALDGGRLIFLLIEAVRGKPVPPEKEGFVHMIGFILLMVLAVFVFFNDIRRAVMGF